jgi:hypothetical protein
MEYLATGVPILGIGDEQSDAATLVKEQTMSQFCDPKAIERITQFITKSFKNWQENTSTLNNFDPEPYSRLAVTHKLAQILQTNN